MTTLDAEAAYARLKDAICASESGGRGLKLIGVHSGGVWIAERLQRDLELPGPFGTLSSAFHRDDYSRRGLPSAIKSTELPFDIEGADILLVDDILFTGRTVRAALNEIFDYGRPARVRLAVLIDRGGRELPVAADFCGLAHALPADRSFTLSRDPHGRFNLVIE
jgi:pyrimidine operon attenuation protein/uracil phosphoribosyltransferase